MLPHSNILQTQFKILFHHLLPFLCLNFITCSFYTDISELPLADGTDQHTGDDRVLLSHAGVACQPLTTSQPCSFHLSFC